MQFFLRWVEGYASVLHNYSLKNKYNWSARELPGIAGSGVHPVKTSRDSGRAGGGIEERQPPRRSIHTVYGPAVIKPTPLICKTSESGTDAYLTEKSCIY